MRRLIALLLTLGMLFTLCGCGRKKKEAAQTTPPPAPTPTPNEVFEVKLSPENLYTYFDYKEYRADVRDENSSEINSSTIAYGFQLKPQFTAANDGEHRDTMTLAFEAEGVVMSGEFAINFDDLSFTGTPETSERVHVSELLHFWPKGDRTTTWAFGNYSSSNIMYFDRFDVTHVSGSVFLKMADLTATPEPSFIPAYMRETEEEKPEDQ